MVLVLTFNSIVWIRCLAISLIAVRYCSLSIPLYGFAIAKAPEKVPAVAPFQFHCMDSYDFMGLVCGGAGYLSIPLYGFYKDRLRKGDE